MAERKGEVREPNIGDGGTPFLDATARSRVCAPPRRSNHAFCLGGFLKEGDTNWSATNPGES
eukprot:15467391-Heterocapsa_arctica.AAC.1